MTSLKTWIRQPTTVAGISALAGTAIAVSLGQMSIGEAVPLIAGSVISILLLDNTAAKQEATDLGKSLAKMGSKAGSAP